MNRRYTRERFVSLALKMRERIPGVAMSTDVIVGFPGETDTDFDDTMDVLETVKFDLVYSFIYSPREGTPASKMDSQVPREASDKRMSRLLKTQDAISEERNSALVGKTLRVLVDSVEKRENKIIASGRAENNKLVHFSVSDERIGYFTNVIITAAGAFDLFAERIEE